MIPARVTVRLVRDVAGLAYDAAGLGLALLTCLGAGHTWGWHVTTIGDRVWCNRCGTHYEPKGDA